MFSWWLLLKAFVQGNFLGLTLGYLDFFHCNFVPWVHVFPHASDDLGSSSRPTQDNNPSSRLLVNLSPAALSLSFSQPSPRRLTAVHTSSGRLSTHSTTSRRLCCPNAAASPDNSSSCMLCQPRWGLQSRLCLRAASRWWWCVLAARLQLLLFASPSNPCCGSPHNLAG